MPWSSSPGASLPPRLDTALRAAPPPPAIRFSVDTFAFLNESRSKNPGTPDLYANWCFVMVRAVTQFHRFARFDGAAPRLGSGECTIRVRRITSRAPWRAPLPPDDRIVIPGYASLFEFSQGEETAFKAGLGGRFCVYDYRVGDRQDVEFSVYDPNDPTSPGLIRFDPAVRGFWSTRVYDTSVGRIRAFRMYYGPLL